jgi:hypothetical protein
LNIKTKDFIEILNDLNYHCHKTRFIFLKSYFDIISSTEIEKGRFENWVKIFTKINVFQEKSLPVSIIDNIFNFSFDKSVCNSSNSIIHFINYLNFLINTNENYIEMLKKIDPETPLGNLSFVEKISYTFKPPQNKQLELDKDLLSFFEISANFLSNNSEENIPVYDLLKGETFDLFENRLSFLSYFKEHKRCENEILSNNNISMNKRNLIILKNSVFYGKTDIKSYLIENNFNKNTILNNKKLNFSENFEKTVITKKYFFEDEEKSQSLKRQYFFEDEEKSQSLKRQKK